MKINYPKGFDMTLAQVISEFDLNDNQIQKLGNLTATRQIANAFVGKNVFYRRATMERLFKPMQVLDE